ncbi:MAG: GNAT family N-acetyltransferase [Planctomycetota bacterium]|nr:GNAT family N-acetyltransferase [Planctomycetota bacterium]
MGSPKIVQADLANAAHQAGIVELLNMYASEPLQGGQPLDDEVQSRLIQGLAAQPNGRYFLAIRDDEAVGLAICFIGFSTFRALPLLNIHDLAVHRDFRGQGIGTRLLDAAEQEAIRLGCCKLTLEVQQENTKARRLYERVGFDSGGPVGAASSFMTKTLA